MIGCGFKSPEIFQSSHLLHPWLKCSLRAPPPGMGWGEHLKIPLWKMIPRCGKWFPPWKRASQRGNHFLAVSHILLTLHFGH